MNVGRMVIGEECFLPCTPAGCIEMLKSSRRSHRRQATLWCIGRSNIVGKPAALLLTAQQRHRHAVPFAKPGNLKAKCAAADIIVAAIGKAGFVTADMVKEGAVVIDVGINRNAEGKLCGDVDFAPVAAKSRLHHSGARRRGPDDAGHADEKHRQGGPPAKRAVSARHMGRKTKPPHREKNTCTGANMLWYSI